jgi:hypothetical protein
MKSTPKCLTDPKTMKSKKDVAFENISIDFIKNEL